MFWLQFRSILRLHIIWLIVIVAFENIVAGLQKESVNKVQPNYGMRLFGQRGHSNFYATYMHNNDIEMSTNNPIELNEMENDLYLFDNGTIGSANASVNASVIENITTTTQSDQYERLGGEEKTISIPDFITDDKGNKIRNIWAVSFGEIPKDTRYNYVEGFTLARLYVKSKPIVNYYKTPVYPTECRASSTIYGNVHVKKWLVRNIYRRPHKHRPLFMPLRRILFRDARSEECHTIKQKDFTKFQECSLRRHQRIEYLIPRYPLHQIGYYSHFSRDAD